MRQKISFLTGSPHDPSNGFIPSDDHLKGTWAISSPSISHCSYSRVCSEAPRGRTRVLSGSRLVCFLGYKQKSPYIIISMPNYQINTGGNTRKEK